MRNLPRLNARHGGPIRSDQVAGYCINLLSLRLSKTIAQMLGDAGLTTDPFENICRTGTGALGSYNFFFFGFAARRTRFPCFRIKDSEQSRFNSFGFSGFRVVLSHSLIDVYIPVGTNNTADSGVSFTCERARHDDLL